jgi:predicted extracellular nuclease
MRDDVGDGGRARTRALRKRQCEAVMAIVRQRFGERAGDHAWAVLGDFNDYLATDLQGHSAIEELVGWTELCDVAARLPQEDRWTHFWRGQPERGLHAAYQQLDYLLLSRSLAARNPALPLIERRGQPQRASRYAGERLEGVGFDRPKASDHCPLAIDLDAL